MQTDEHSRETLAIFVFGDKNDVAKYEDCQAAFENGHSISGVYTLQPAGFNTFNAWCDFDGSNGWTVIQRRTDGNVDFDRNWDEFKKGFGYLNGDLWLGNDNIHALTLTNQKLSISLKMSGADYTANYSTFAINDEGDNYRLTISGYNGDLYDAMAENSGHNLDGMQFSTWDRDNDEHNANCASYASGECTASTICNDVSHVIVELLWDPFVTALRPTTAEEMDPKFGIIIMVNFGKDGCHLRLKCPAGGVAARQAYHNFKHVYFIVLMAMTDGLGRFIWAGNTHGSTYLQSPTFGTNCAICAI